MQQVKIVAQIDGASVPFTFDTTPTPAQVDEKVRRYRQSQKDKAATRERQQKTIGLAKKNEVGQFRPQSALEKEFAKRKRQDDEYQPDPFVSPNQRDVQRAEKAHEQPQLPPKELGYQMGEAAKEIGTKAGRFVERHYPKKAEPFITMAAPLATRRNVTNIADLAGQAVASPLDIMGDVTIAASEDATPLERTGAVANVGLKTLPIDKPALALLSKVPGVSRAKQVVSSLLTGQVEKPPVLPKAEKPNVIQSLLDGEPPKVVEKPAEVAPKPKFDEAPTAVKQAPEPKVEPAQTTGTQSGPQLTQEQQVRPQEPTTTVETIATPQKTEVTPAVPEEPKLPVEQDMAVTQGKNAATAKYRKDLGLEELPEPQRKSFQTSLDNAKEQGLDHRAASIAAEVNSKARALTDEESAGMTLRLAQLRLDHVAALNAMEHAIDAGHRDSITRFGLQLEHIETEFNDVTAALKKSGTEAARSLAIRKLAINTEYDLVSVLQRTKAAKEANLKPAERARIESLTKLASDLQSQLDAARASSSRIRPNPKAGGSQAPQSILDRVTAENKTFTADRVRAAMKELLGAPLGSGAEGVARITKAAYEIAGAFVEAGYRRFSRFMAEIRAAHPDIANKLSLEEWEEVHKRAKGDLDKLSPRDTKALPEAEQLILTELRSARETRAKALGAVLDEEKKAARRERIVQEFKAEQMARADAQTRMERRKQAREGFKEGAEQQRKNFRESEAEGKAQEQVSKAIRDVESGEIKREQAKLTAERRRDIRKAFSEEDKAQKKAQADYDREYRQRAAEAEKLQHTAEMFDEMAKYGPDANDIEHQGAMEHFVSDLLDAGHSAEEILQKVRTRLPKADPYEAAQLVSKAVTEYRGRFQAGRSISEQYLERGAAAIQGEDVSALRRRLDHVKRLIDAEVGKVRPQASYQKLDKFLTSNALASITNRLLDIASNTVSFAGFLVEHPIKVAISPILDRFVLRSAGYGIERPLSPSRIKRITTGARERLATTIKETMAGADPDTLAKYGQSNMVTRATGLTDVPFKEFYTQFRLDDLATTTAQHLAKSKKDVDGLRDQILAQFRDPEAKGPLTAAEVEDGLAIAHDFALRQTFNVDNIASQIAQGIQGGIMQRGKQVGPAGETAAGFANTLLIKPLTRFSKVIGNVTLDRANYHPALGLGEAVGRILFQKGKPFSPEQAALVNRLAAKGLAGLALTQAGRYLYANGHKPEVVKTKGGKHYIDWKDLDQVGGPIAPILYGMTLEAAQDLDLTAAQRERFIWDTNVSILANQPLLTGPQRGFRALENAKSFQKFSGSMAANAVIPAGVRDWARRQDAVKSGRSPFDDREVQADTFVDQFKKGIPFVREGLPDQKRTIVKAKSR